MLVLCTLLSYLLEMATSALEQGWRSIKQNDIVKHYQSISTARKYYPIWLLLQNGVKIFSFLFILCCWRYGKE